jgi:hypothetical protein
MAIFRVFAPIAGLIEISGHKVDVLGHILILVVDNGVSFRAPVVPIVGCGDISHYTLISHDILRFCACWRSSVVNHLPFLKGPCAAATHDFRLSTLICDFANIAVNTDSDRGGTICFY